MDQVDISCIACLLFKNVLELRTWRHVLAGIHSLGQRLRQVQDAQLAQGPLQRVACTTKSR